MAYPALENEYFTIEDYLALSESAEISYEYEHGKIVAMGSSSKVHNRLIRNTSNILFQATDKKNCEVFSESIKLEVEKDGVYYLPDVVLSCDHRDKADPQIIRFPSLIIEVLSPGSEKRDRGKKFHAYLKIPSLVYYILVSQNQLKVEVFTKINSGGWRYQIYDEIDQFVSLTQLEFELRIAEIYSGIGL